MCMVWDVLQVYNKYYALIHFACNNVENQLKIDYQGDITLNFCGISPENDAS